MNAKRNARILSALLIGSVTATACNSPQEGEPASSLVGKEGPPPVLDCSAATEIEPNDVVARAMGLTPSETISGCLNADSDVFKIRADVQPSGGYFVATVRLDAKAASRAYLRVSEEGSGTVADSGAESRAGEPLQAYWTSKPGVVWTLSLDQRAQDGGSASEAIPYDIQVLYVPVVDTFEPNDVRDEAKPIVVGTPVQASLVGGLKTSNLADIEHQSTDWYRIRVEVEEVRNIRIRLTDIPFSARPIVSLLCPVCTHAGPADEREQSSPGQDIDWTRGLSSSGEYFIVVRNTSADNTGVERGPLYVGGSLPDHFSKNYTLTVTRAP